MSKKISKLSINKLKELYIINGFGQMIYDRDTKIKREEILCEIEKREKIK